MYVMWKGSESMQKSRKSGAFCEQALMYLFSDYYHQNSKAAITQEYTVFGSRYTLYVLLSATDEIPLSTLHHLNVVCGGEQIVQRIANTVYFYVITSLSMYIAGDLNFLICENLSIKSHYCLLVCLFVCFISSLAHDTQSGDNTIDHLLR